MSKTQLVRIEGAREVLFLKIKILQKTLLCLLHKTPASSLSSFYFPLLIGMLVGKHSLSWPSHPGGPLVEGPSPGLLAHCWCVPSGDLQLLPSSPQPPAVLTDGLGLLPFLPFPYLPTLPLFQTLSEHKLFSVTALKSGLSSSPLCWNSSLYNHFISPFPGWSDLFDISPI